MFKSTKLVEMTFFADAEIKITKNIEKRIVWRDSTKPSAHYMPNYFPKREKGAFGKAASDSSRGSECVVARACSGTAIQWALVESRLHLIIFSLT